MGQITVLAESLYNVKNNFYSLCNRGLLNGYLATYGSELIVLNNDIVSQGGKKPVCLSSEQNYCISTQLIDGSYICVDNTGAMGTTKCISSATVCK
jgi:hypothetical protein